jgi:hypothetical protein
MRTHLQWFWPLMGALRSTLLECQLHRQQEPFDRAYDYPLGVKMPQRVKDQLDKPRAGETQ